ncbi:MAG: hypothetical protein ABIJ56_04350 [Pseudomonadota bacterium]
MSRNKPNLIPASLQRVRCFMSGRAGLNVKPWAGAHETLDAFHDLLVTKRRDEDFWKALESLLGTLSADMKERLADKRGEIIDNEVLDSSTHHELLAEIRSSLGGGRAGRGRFRRLAQALSVPAMGLLFILGGVATVGCDQSTSLHGDGSTEDAAPDTSDDSAADPAVDPAIDPAEDPAVDTSEEEPCESVAETLDEMITTCIEYEDEAAHYKECIDELHESWRTGLEELFKCEDCYDIQGYLRDCLGWRCGDPGNQGEFDLDDFLNNCAVMMYLGVRFE